MERIRSTLIVGVLAVIIAWQAPGIAAAGDDVPRMTKEELKILLGSPDVVVLDVRFGGGSAPRRITGSVFEDPDRVPAWSADYPKGKKIVLYCS